MFKWIRTAARRFTNALISGLSNPADWFRDFIRGGTTSDSGVTVNVKTTLGYAPVWYAVSKIAGHVCTLPLDPYRRLANGGAEKARTHPAFRLVRTRPNPYQSAAQFWETLMVHALLQGNGKAAIIRDTQGRPTQLLLLLPERSVTCYIDGVKWHAVRIDDDEQLATNKPRSSISDQTWVKIPDADVLHIPGLGVDGTVGLEIYKISENTFGLGLAAEKAANKDFANGSKPGMLLQAPTGVLVDDKDAKEFINNFNNFHSSLDNRGKAGLLREGITATTVPVSNNEAQWVDQRRFQRQEVALLFLLEAILGDDTSVSYNSIEQKNLQYLANCLMRWLVKTEQECDEKLLSGREKRASSHFFKFNTAALLRADFKSTIEALGLAITHRIMNPNEARKKLDMNPYEGGDEYFNPAITPGDSSKSSDTDTAASGGQSKQSGNARELSPAEAIQKIYLGVDTVVSSDEARELVNEQTGATLPIPGPQFGAAASSEPPTPEEANQRAATAHLAHMIGIECKEVLGAAGNQGNYLSWLDRFYDKKFRGTLSNAVDSLGGDRSIAEDHCEKSRSELLHIAGTVTPEGLADAVAETIQDWPSRAEQLTAQVLGETSNV